MRILLAVDASVDSRNAARFITHFAEPPDLSVLKVLDIGALQQAYHPGRPEGSFEAYRREVSQAAERVLHETRDELSPSCRTLRLIADSGDPAESIIQTAEEERSELIVVGHRGMTATSAFLLGGVSQKVATYAPCSVLVVKQPTPALHRVLLAVDGSEWSNKAVEFLATVPLKAPLKLAVVTVWSSPPSEPRSPETGSAESSEGVSAMRVRDENLLQEVATRFRTGPYEVRTEWLHGDPATAILETAGRSQAELVVVGARGLKGIKRFLLGSVSQKVLTHAPCSVLILR